jgi:hypothetical protein
MIVAVILDKRLVLKESALVCVGEHREISGYQKLIGLHVDNMALASKVQAIGEPVWRPCDYSSASDPQGYDHFWGAVMLSMYILGPSRMEE